MMKHFVRHVRRIVKSRVFDTLRKVTAAVYGKNLRQGLPLFWSLFVRFTLALSRAHHSKLNTSTYGTNVVEAVQNLPEIVQE
jgi:hypothetical protein